MFKNLLKVRNNVSRACVRGMSSNFQFLNVTTVDGIMTVKFNSPKTYNSMTVDMGEEFSSLVNGFDKNYPDVKVVVFTGEGKAFSAGGDKQFLVDRSTDTASNNMYEMNRFYNRFLSVRKFPVPTIAMINGPAVGAGACFTLACDLRIASTNATIGFVFSKLGLHPGMAATHFLPKLVGQQQATKLLLTGEIISAEEARKIGILAETTEPEDLQARVTALAKQMAEQDCLATRLLVRTLRGSMDNGLDAALIREAETQALCYADSVYAKRVDDMVNKRNK